jgi:hypothetical protein
MAQLVLDQKDNIGDWVARQVGQKTTWGDFNAFGIVENGEVIAGVVIHNYAGSNAFCHIAIFKKTKLLPTLFKCFVHYSFSVCKLKRLTALLPTNKPKVIDFVKHLGFEEEFVMKDAGKASDIQGLVMWPSKCRWLTQEAKNVRL